MQIQGIESPDIAFGIRFPGVLDQYRMKSQGLFALLLAAVLTACVSRSVSSVQLSHASPDPLSTPLALKMSFAGLILENAKEGGALVTNLVAGPAAVAGVRRGDRILRIGDETVDAARARQIILATAPGTRLVLHILREARALQIPVEVAARERWSGPAAFTSAVPFLVAQGDGLRQDAGSVFERVVAGTPEIAPYHRRLDRMFTELAGEDTGFHKLPLIRTALMHPDTMAEWRDGVLAKMRIRDEEHAPIIELICGTLGVVCPATLAIASDEQPTLEQFAAVIATTNKQVRKVFDSAKVGRRQATADLAYLLEQTATERTLHGRSADLRGIRAMQLSMRVDFPALIGTANRLLANATRLPTFRQTSRQLPAALRTAVKGDIMDFWEIEAGYVVIGGSGSNSYVMGKLYAVIEPGGNDVYQWDDQVPLETQTIVDLSGDDRYEAVRGGPAAGWLGVAILMDRAGNDHYESSLGGCGAGLLGIGLLFDYSGADTYHCAAWSLGAAVYGSGMLIDRGKEADTYVSQTFSQAVGGPRGLGVLLDENGDDLYRANGPVPSAYGTPGSYMAFSQGVGVGIRPYDTGGVGVLLDLGGNDRYEGGEFSQGGGYFWGIGLLHDAAGDDLYYGNRYAQGFAAHQAVGMLSDMGGDDHYWSMTAAAQGAAWDQSIAVLFDGGGNDVYRADALSQGAAAQQSRALLHDVSGDDVYASAAKDAQGAAGDNNYHFASEDPVYSLGVLLDQAGADRYSTRLKNGERRIRSESAGTGGAGTAGIAEDRD
ncbi:MAG: PDZ domain-containing protein [Burkholderiales bacterium]